MMFRGLLAFSVLLLASSAMADQTSLSIALPTKVEAARIDPMIVPAEAVMHGQDIHVEEPFCVYSNDTENGDYQVTLSGSGANNAFELSSGQHQFVYHVAFNDEDSPTGFVPVKANATLSDQTAGGIQTYPCYKDNARIRLIIPSAAYGQLPAGTYTGTLYITVGED